MKKSKISNKTWGWIYPPVLFRLKKDPSYESWLLYSETNVSVHAEIWRYVPLWEQTTWSHNTKIISRTRVRLVVNSENILWKQPVKFLKFGQLILNHEFFFSEKNFLYCHICIGSTFTIFNDYGDVSIFFNFFFMIPK